MGRRLIAGAGRIGPVADADSGTVLRVVDLEVDTFEGAGLSRSQIDGHLDDIAAIDDRAGGLDHGLLDILRRAGAEAQLRAIGGHANLLDVVGVLAALGVAAVDVYLHGVLLPRIRVGQVDVRVGHFHEDIQLAVRPQGLGGSGRLGGRRGGGHLIHGNLVGFRPDGIRRVGVNDRSLGVGGNLHGFRVAQRLGQRDGAGVVRAPRAGLRGGGIRRDDVHLDDVLLCTGVWDIGHDFVSGIRRNDVGLHTLAAGHTVAADRILGVTHTHGDGVVIRRADIGDIRVDDQRAVLPIDIERAGNGAIRRRGHLDQRKTFPRRGRAGLGHGTGKRRVDAHGVILECVHALQRLGKVGAITDVADVRRLLLQVVVEQQRSAFATTPGQSVDQAPHRNGEQLRSVTVDDLIYFIVVLALFDELGLRDRGSGRHVQFGDGLLLVEALHVGQRGLQVRGRRGQRHMELVADAVERHAFGNHTVQQGSIPGALTRLLGVVIVDEQRHRMIVRRIGVHLVEVRVRILERVIDVVLTVVGLVPQRIAHAVGVRIVGVVHGFVDDIERHDGIHVAAERTELIGDRLGDVLDVLTLTLLHRGLVGQRAAGDTGGVIGVLTPFVRLEEPVGRLGVPHQNVAVDPDVVVAGELQQAPGVIGHGELMIAVVPAFRLHRVFRSDLVEVGKHRILPFLAIETAIGFGRHTGGDAQSVVLALDATGVVAFRGGSRRSECQRHQHGYGRKRRDDATALGRPTFIGCIEQCVSITFLIDNGVFLA